MKKALCYMPLAVYVVYISAGAFINDNEVSLNFFPWMLIFLLAGILLTKGFAKGAILGILPSVDLAYVSFSSGEKDVLGLLLGILFTGFYVFCAVYICKKRKQ